MYKAKEFGYHPQVILAGRAINDFMSKHVAEMAIKGLNEVGKVIKGSKVLIMGLTYKENVPDTRESPVREMVKELKEFGVEAYGYDPLLSKEEIEGFGVRALDDMLQITDYCPKGAWMVLLWHWGMINKDFLLAQVFFCKKKKCVDVRGMFDGEAEKLLYMRL